MVISILFLSKYRYQQVVIAARGKALPRIGARKVICYWGQPVGYRAS